LEQQEINEVAQIAKRNKREVNNYEKDTADVLSNDDIARISMG
jgi:hypothetical protein